MEIIAAVAWHDENSLSPDNSNLKQIKIVDLSLNLYVACTNFILLLLFLFGT